VVSCKQEIETSPHRGRPGRYDRAWGNTTLLLRPGALGQAQGASGLLLARRVRRPARPHRFSHVGAPQKKVSTPGRPPDPIPGARPPRQH